MDLREVQPVDGMGLFEIEPIEVTKGAPFVLPNIAALLGEEEFFSLSITFSEEALLLDLSVDQAFAGCFLPDYEKGDAFELLLDTRGIAGAKSLHKYCHRLVFLPKEVEGCIATEVTRLRMGEKRDLVDTTPIVIESTFKRKSYHMQIQIPDRSLYGYDIASFSKLRLGCICYRGKELSGHFPYSQIDYKLQSYPALWAPINLI